MEIKRIENTKLFILIAALIVLCIVGLNIYKNYWVNAQEVKTTYLHFQNENVSSQLLSEDGAIEFAGEVLECVNNQDGNVILQLKNGSYEVKTVDNNRNITKITITGYASAIESAVNNVVETVAEEIATTEAIAQGDTVESSGIVDVLADVSVDAIKEATEQTVEVAEQTVEVETILSNEVVSEISEEISEKEIKIVSEIIPEIEESNGWVSSGNNTYVWENPNGAKSVTLNCITPNEYMTIQSIEIVYVETNEPVKACEHDGMTFGVCPMCGVDLGTYSKNIAELIEGEQLNCKIALYNDAGDLTVQYYDYESDVMSGQLLTAVTCTINEKYTLENVNEYKT